LLHSCCCPADRLAFATTAQAKRAQFGPHGTVRIDAVEHLRRCADDSDLCFFCICIAITINNSADFVHVRHDAVQSTDVKNDCCVRCRNADRGDNGVRLNARVMKASPLFFSLSLPQQSLFVVGSL
jgi:hypothetical protein